ncbi:tetratricopeptide repeat protein [Tenacibaculum sp.]|uniref:tetratricopeptide repeat protein n=1 Tax=Tenacibaculum sp. TaxID=1906242 RepID=UPI003D09E800
MRDWYKACKHLIIDIKLGLALLIFLSITSISYSQLDSDTKIINNLETQLKQANKEDKLQILLQLCSYYVEKDSGKCVLYGKQALELSRELNNPRAEVEALTFLGRENSNIGNYFEALQKFKTAKKIAVDKQLEDNIISTLNEIGITYFHLGMYNNALEYYFESLNKAKELNRIDRIAQLQNNIAIIYSIYEDYDNALKWFNSLIDIYTKENKEMLKAKTLVNISNIYTLMGDYDKSMESIEKAIPVFTKLGESQMLTTAFNSLGDIFLGKENLLNAYLNYNKSLEISETIKYARGIIVASHNLGRYYLASKDYDKAILFFEKSLALSIQNKDREHIKDNYRELADAYAHTGDYKKALESKNHFIVYNNQIYNDKTQKQINELKIKYETEKKEEEIKNLELNVKRQQRNLIILIVGLLVISFLIFRNLNLHRKSLKRDNLLLEQEKEIDKLALEKINAEKKKQDLENLRLQEEIQAKEEINKLRKQKYKTEIKLKERELTTNALHIVNKNEALQTVKESVSAAMENAKSAEVKKALKSLVKSIDSNINLDKDWENFKIHFEGVHQGFFKELVAKHPDLNANELRFSAYLRLNLDTKEVARVLNISVNAVEKRRYRLRKKFDLNPKDSLYEYLSNF